MASAVRTTEGPSGNVSAAERNVMNANFTAGETIAAGDLTYLRDRINAVCGHTHKLTDYSKIGEFGNTGSTASTYEDTTAAGSDVSLNIGAGTTISASHFNSLRAAVNTVRSHNHGWTDN
jgi:hypothetical protein